MSIAAAAYNEARLAKIAVEAGGDPIGTIKMGIGLPADKWIPCDGRSVSRAAWPALSATHPIGTFTGTARTLVEAAPNRSITASPTYFVATGSSGGGSSLQYSTDGATWVKTGVSHAAGFTSEVLWAGSRFVATFGGAVRPHVTTGGNPGSTWTATTGGPDSYNAADYGMAYSPELGRTVAINATQAFTLDDGSTTWTTRSTTGLANEPSICWTGSRFLIAKPIGANLFSSADGITWSSTSFALMTPNAHIVSNDAGVVVALYQDVNVTKRVQVSTDHGANWTVAPLPGSVLAASTTLAYSGGMFFVSGAGFGFFVSQDGLNWQQETTPMQSATYGKFAKKGSTIVQISDTATAYSFTESSTDFRAPALQDWALLSAVDTTYANPLAPYYIKGA